MPNHKSAVKRVRQNEKRRLLNKQHRSKMRTQVKKVESAIVSEDAEKAGSYLQEALRVLDKSASKGIIHKNQAARKKSNLTRKVNHLAAGA